MEYIQNPTHNMRISKIAFGCWAVGGGSEWGKKLDDTVYTETIRRAREGGINLFDTAAAYGNGYSEQILGKALADAREKVYVSSKANARHLRQGQGSRTVEENLKRLSMDYIDIFFMHWPSPDIAIEETMEELLTLKDQALIRAIGLSNVTTEHLDRAIRVGPVDFIQPAYSLFWRQAEQELIPYCVEKNIDVITYSSIAQGLLTGKYTPKHIFEEGDQRPQIIPLFQGELFTQAIEASRRIGEIARGYGKTTTQVAINWLVRQKGVTAAIVGAKTPRQIQETLGSLDWSMSQEDYERTGQIGMRVAEKVIHWDSMYQKVDERMKIKNKP